MYIITKWIERKLGLKVNAEKTIDLVGGSEKLEEAQDIIGLYDLSLIKTITDWADEATI